jgi:hypothetical protein
MRLPVAAHSALQSAGIVGGTPEQRHLRIAIERTLNTIDLALDHSLTSLEIR